MQPAIPVLLHEDTAMAVHTTFRNLDLQGFRLREKTQQAAQHALAKNSAAGLALGMIMSTDAYRSASCAHVS